VRYVKRQDLADVVEAEGRETVKVFNLDRREAMAKGYVSTLNRIKAVVDAALNEAQPDAADLVAKMRETDDHGLLAWCLKGSGRDDYPFADLRERYPCRVSF